MTALDTTLHEMATPRRGLLSKAMLVNATVSGISGAGLALGAPALDEWLGLNMWVLVGVGVGLVGFAIDLRIWARSAIWLKRGGKLAVAGDIVWVLASVELIGFTDVLTPSGNVALAAITVMVAAFAVVQTIGLKQLPAEAV
ncbi:MAG: hypothetical protein IIB04_07415 [Acidobacteria bacterium]|nr:hypothetical protein [Acidobacteriota bacterium]